MHRVTALVTASILALAHAGTAGAQSITPDVSQEPAAQASSDQQAKGGIEEIIVTAEKRSANINQVPMSINAVSGDTLVAQGITSPADLGKLVPGFTFTRSAYGVPVFTLRGIGFYDTSLAGSPTVSLYTDEIPLPYNAMSTGAGLDVERVEVLKGPQGTLYGQNSTGGAINYISAKPTNAPSAGIDVTYQSFDEVIVQGFASAPISDTLRVRVSARAHQGGNWQKSYTRSDRNGKADLIIGRILFDWTPTDDLLVEVNINGWLDKSENQAGAFGGLSTATAPAVIANYPFPPRDNRAADWDPSFDWARDDHFYQFSGRVEYKLNDALKLTSLTSYAKLHRDAPNDTDGTAFPSQYVNQLGYIKSFYQELRISGDISSRASFVLGGNYGHDSIYEMLENYTPAGFSTSAFTAGAFQGGNKIDRYAVFGTVDYHLTDRLTFQAGARYADTKRDFHGCSLDIGSDRSLSTIIGGAGDRLRGYPVAVPAGQCATLGPAPTYTPQEYVNTLKEDNISWRASLNWQLSSTALLYGNISRGFKEGVFPASGATFDFSLSPVTEEKVLAYEAGFKLGLADRRVQINGAVFYYDYSDKQIRARVSDPVIGRQNRMINIPNSHVAGAELDVTLVPVDGLRLNVSGTYVDSKIEGSFLASDPFGNAKDVGGEPFPLTPRWQLQGDAEYGFPVSTNVEMFVGGHYTYQSKSSSGLGAVSTLSIPGYTLLDLRAGVRTPDNRWSLTGFVRNLTDKYYYNFVSFAATNSLARYTGRPRTFGATLSYRY